MAETSSARRGDILAVTLSSLAGIIQLLLFIIGTLGQVVGLQKLFARYDLIPFTIIISMIISLCVIGVISFARKNQYSFLIQPVKLFKPFVWLNNKLFISQGLYPQFQRSYITFLFTIAIMMIITAVIFIFSTLQYLTSQPYAFINNTNVDAWQTLSFIGLWTMTPIILFMWLSDEIEKNYQFKPEDFLPNLVKSLQAQGFIQIKITHDIQKPGEMQHFVAANIQGKNKYFTTDYDGKKITRELTLEEFQMLIQPQAR